jgi:hypothetical protein
MAGPFREKIFAVAFVIEDDTGVDQVPTLANNAVRCSGIPELVISDLESGDRSDISFGDFGTIDQAPPAGSNAKIDLQLELAGAGAAYAADSRPPNGLDALLQCSNMVESHSYTVDAEKVEYTTVRTGNVTGSLYAWTNDTLYKVVGCVASWKIDLEMAKRAFITFSVQGKFIGDVAQAIGAIEANEIVPPLFHSQEIDVGAWTSADVSEPLVVKKIGIDSGITITDRGSAGADDGLIGYIITDQDVSQTMTVERVSKAKFDPDAIVKSGGSVTDTKATYQVGGTQYNRVKFSLGQWLLTRPKRSNASGLLTWDLAGKIKQYSEPLKSRDITITFD